MHMHQEGRDSGSCGGDTSVSASAMTESESAVGNTSRHDDETRTTAHSHAPARKNGDARRRRKKRGGDDDDAAGASPSGSVALLPTQTAHVAKLASVMQRSTFALDFSMLGTGKTFTTTYLAASYPRVVVVCPVSVKPKWMSMRKHHGLRLSHVLGYSELRSMRCKQPRHGLLMRRDYTVEVYAQSRRLELDKADFMSTRAWKELVDEGVFLVFDEIQNLKNVGSQFAAAQALIRPITERSPAASRSRVLMLSGSPFDKMEQVATFFRTLGVSRHDELGTFVPSQMQMRWTGLQHIVDYCATLDATKTSQVVDTEASANMKLIAYRLFQEVLKPHVASTMPPCPCGASSLKFSAFYEVLDHGDRERLAHGVNALAGACMYNPREGTVNFATTGNGEGGSIQRVALALLQIETAKIGTFARVARRALEEHPTRKVAICVSFTSTISDLKQALSDYDPLVLNGSVGVQARADVLERFQRPSSQYRVLIGNSSTCSTGIDLDDKHGGFPRFVLISPNYSTIMLFQLGQRFIRADTRSDSLLHFVFGKHARETGVLRALSSKSAVMKSTACIEGEQHHDVPFPGDYMPWEEEDPPQCAPPLPHGVRRATHSG